MQFTGAPREDEMLRRASGSAMGLLALSIGATVLLALTRGTDRGELAATGFSRTLYANPGWSRGWLFKP
jgi:hypothetical protein